MICVLKAEGKSRVWYKLLLRAVHHESSVQEPSRSEGPISKWNLKQMEYKRSVLLWIQLFWEKFMEANSEMWLCFSNTLLWTEQSKPVSWSACHPKPKPDLDQFSGDVTWKIHCERLFCAVRCWILNCLQTRECPLSSLSTELQSNLSSHNITDLHMCWSSLINLTLLSTYGCLTVGFQRINKIWFVFFWLFYLHQYLWVWTLYWHLKAWWVFQKDSQLNLELYIYIFLSIYII